MLKFNIQMFAEADGTVIIKATLDDKEFDSKYNKLVQKAQKKDVAIEVGLKEVDETNAKLELQRENLKYIEQEYDKIAKKAERYAELEFKMNNKTATNAEFFEYAALEDVGQEEQKLLDQIYKSKKGISDTEQLLVKQKQHVKDLSLEYNNIVKQAEEYKEKIEQTKYDKIKQEINNIGNSIQEIVKKTIRWGLAIFGIRGAYMAIRNAINVISQQDEQLAADINYIRNALAYTLEPIVRSIVDWLKQIMYYVAYITKAWGKNIFENANKSLKKTVGTAKELKKQLAGFDEMNVLSDNSSSSGASAPSFDLTQMQGEVPGWIQWIAENGDTIKQIILDIGLAIAALKISELIEELGILGDLPLWGKVAAIFLILHGAKTIYKGIIDFIENPSWENFLEVIQGIAEVVAGLSLLFGGWKLAVVALGIALVAYIIRNWDKIKEKMQQFKQWIVDRFIQPIKDKFNALPGWAKTLIGGIVNIAIGMLNVLIDSINAFLLPLRGAIAVIGKIMGKSWSLETVKIPRIPFMAKGAIINQPGRGVPVGGGFGGERGQEGVLPLTDSQQMELLGQSIGRYVNINATIPVYVGNRQIAREIKKINAEDDFAYNR